MKRKKPDLLVVLAVIIGMGMLATELTYGGAFASDEGARIVSQR